MCTMKNVLTVLTLSGIGYPCILTSAFLSQCETLNNVELTAVAKRYSSLSKSKCYVGLVMPSASF